MAIIATEVSANGQSTISYTATYDSTKAILGKWMLLNTDSQNLAPWIGPQVVPQRLGDWNAASVSCITGFKESTNTDIVIVADSATAATTRKMHAMRFNKNTATWSYLGAITVTPPPGTNHTVRGIKIVQHTYTTNTVSVSGTTVTGSSTTWQTNRYAVGAHIGFNTSDPTAVTQWYPITAIASDTSITIAGSPGTLSNVSYVIEEYRLYFVTTASTATNGGLFVVKGLTGDDFGAGTTFGAAVSTDNVKATYWLADASTVTATTTCGIDAAASFTDTSHNIYVVNGAGTTSCVIYKHNGRAALTLNTGKDTTTLTFKTGTGTVATNLPTQDVCTLATASHGNGSGVLCLYLADSTRIYRCADTSITNGGTSFLSDNMTEKPPGGTNTYAQTGTMNSITYLPSIDYFLIATTAGRTYVTKYDTGATAFNYGFLSALNQWDNGAASQYAMPTPSVFSVNIFSPLELDGYLYLNRGGQAITNSYCTLYAIPIISHWDFNSSNQNRLVLPAITTSNVNKYLRVYVNGETLLPQPTASSRFPYDYDLAMPTEPIRVSYRTSGISDNSGSWTTVTAGNLLSVSPASSIQFMIEFKVLGNTTHARRFYSLCLIYEDTNCDSHFEPVIDQTSIASNQFVWRCIKKVNTFDTNAQSVRVTLTNIDTAATIIDDYSSSPSGTFENNLSGAGWTSFGGNITTLGPGDLFRYTTSSASGLRCFANLRIPG